MYSGSYDHPLYHSRIELKNVPPMGFEPMRSLRPADLKSAPLDQLGQSGALGTGVEPVTPRLTVGCSNQLS